MKAGVFIAFGCALVSVAGCTNNQFQGAFSGSSNGVGAPSPIQGSLPINGTTSGLVLSRVLPDTLDPGATFDLTDDLSGSMAGFCATNNNAAGGGGAAGGAANGATTCNCAYTYTKADGSTESIEVPTIYHERDLIRCKYDSLPSGLSFVRVKIHMTNSDTYSNEVIFRFTGTGISLDLADPNSFAPVQRFQCRDTVDAPYTFGNQIYDPIQSDDPQITYPRNFYTTNMGKSLACFAGGCDGAAAPAGGFSCPALPNDPTSGTDLTIYSEGPDSGGSKQIFPPQGSVFDRYNFFLARQPSGVFNVPVDAYMYPGGPATRPGTGTPLAPNGGPLPLGYGATPVAGAAGQETCPDSTVTIPAGYHWVKVWLFRADLAPRNFLVSKTFQSGINEIDCAPPQLSFQPAPGASPAVSSKIFPDCDPNTATPVSDGMTGLATRIMTGLQNLCVNVTPGGSTDSTGKSLSTTNAPNGSSQPYSSYFGSSSSQMIAPGSDTWTWLGVASGQPADNSGCQGPSGFPAALDPGLCSPPSNSVSGGPANTAVIPFDNNPTRQPIQDDVTNPKYDFLFVVSPPTVMVADMANSSTSTHFIYTPFRFMSPGDCNSSDPDHPTSPGDCPARRMIRNYGLKFHDVGSNGDPPAGDSRPGVFPVCAIQPD